MQSQLEFFFKEPFITAPSPLEPLHLQQHCGSVTVCSVSPFQPPPRPTMGVMLQEASLAWQKRRARSQTRGMYSGSNWMYSPAAGAANSGSKASSPRQRMQYSNMLAAAEAARR